MDRESKNLIIGKDRDEPEIDKRLTKRILKILLTHTTKSSNRQTSHHRNARQNWKTLKIHNFSITKFGLAQTKLGKFYPNIKIIRFLGCDN